MQKAVKLFILLVTVALAAATVLVWNTIFTEDRTDGLSVTFLNVGQGDAIFIESPNGRQILIDGGPDKDVLAALGEVVAFHDRSIDIIISTHPDLDHVGGLLSVLKNYDVGYIIESSAQTDTAHFREFKRMAQEEGAQRITATRGQSIHIGDGAVLTILFPDRIAPNIESNYASVVARLDYGETSFLFMGDAPSAIEEYLALLDPESLDVDVLKAGHHGSKTSSSRPFVAYASPLYAIISAGEKNRYGHPHQEVLDIFENFGVTVLRTDLNGSITIKSDKSKLTIK